MVAHEAHVMLRGFERTGDDPEVLNDDLLFSLSNQATLIITKFLEVWDDFGGCVPSDPRVLRSRQAVTPIVDRINVWPSLKRHRHTATAHAYLTRDGKLIAPWHYLASNEAPSFHAEVLLLLQLMTFGVLSVLSVFEVEYQSLKPILANSIPQPGPEPGIAHGKEIPEEVRRVSDDVDKAMQSYGVEVSRAIASEFAKASGRDMPGTSPQ